MLIVCPHHLDIAYWDFNIGCGAEVLVVCTNKSGGGIVRLDINTDISSINTHICSINTATCSINTAICSIITAISSINCVYLVG